MRVFVIEWQYGDKSNHGIVGIYADEDLALLLLDKLKGTDGLKLFRITEHDVEGRALRDA